MSHPYRSPPPPEERPTLPEDDGCPDTDIAVALLVTMAAAAAHVIWAARAGQIDGQWAAALGTALVCLVLLAPFLWWVLRRTGLGIWNGVTGRWHDRARGSARAR